MKQTLLSATVLAAMAAGSAFAQDETADQNDLTLKVFAGIEYSDNVAVSAIDASSGESDFAGTLDVGVGFKTDMMSDLKLDLSYDFSKVEYLDASEFSLDTHSFAAGLAWEFGDLDVGADAGWVQSSLAGDKFLTQTRLSPSVAKMVGDATYVRASWTYTDINFANINERDGSNNSFGLDSFVFLTDEGFVNFGISVEKENTVADEFDYDAWTVNGGIQVPFLDTTFNASINYSKRDYDLASAVMPGSEARNDDRFTFRANIETDLFAVLTLRPEYTFRNISSNVAQYDYKEHVIGVKLGYVF